MSTLFFNLLLIALLANAVLAFQPRFAGRTITKSATRVYEDFNLDFKNPTIVSSPEIFSEKQLREFTATYYDDVRWNPFQALFSLFNKDGNKKEEAPVAPKSKITSSLKNTISIQLLEERTASFVKGKIDAKTFNGVLVAAFGDKLKVVLPEILANLPKDKAAALSKITK